LIGVCDSRGFEDRSVRKPLQIAADEKKKVKDIESGLIPD
jgi:hypothetical protein